MSSMGVNGKRKRERFVFVCKTYAGDYKQFCRLLDSYREHNVDDISLYVSVPGVDEQLFRECVGDDATIITDESYAGKYFVEEEYWGLSKGYLNQEVCKLSFWETGVAENYLCIDSDVYFIRDFYRKDFMFNDHTPYSVLVMDKDLNTERFYRDYGVHRMSMIGKIFDFLEYDDPRRLTCHGMTVLNSKVLNDLNDNILQKRGLSYRDLLKISPFEYTWYNVWLQRSRVIDVVMVEPFFKTFHMRIEYVFSRMRLIREADIASQYVGIVLNSNWKPKSPPETYEKPGLVHEVLYKLIKKWG